ncbi:MAG: caspase family protein, partial [Burkholderiaceae bacterium]|nr:caspase family protein [Burkholderiaceae bacterium]
VPDVVWAVAISGDGQSVVAAYGDGTLGWHRLADGERYLTAFIHAEDRRWIAWTPEGFYWASAGAEDLIGWHLNRGVDQEPDFVPASRWRERYSRPAVVQAALERRDAAAALAVAARQPASAPPALPPQLRILEPLSGTAVRESSLVLRVQVRSPLPLTGWQVLIDGVRAGEQRGLKRVLAADGEELRIPVTLPPRDCEVAVVAFSEAGASEAERVRLRWAGSAALASELPRLVVLAVGVGNYRDPELRLLYPVRDAEAVAAAWARQRGRLYREVQVRLERDPTRVQLLEACEWLTRQVTSRDVAVLFLAGHGMVDERGGYYFLPVDGEAQRLRATAVAQSELIRALEDTPGMKLAFFDTCHAGALGRERARQRGLAADATELLNRLADAEVGVGSFHASTARQPSWEREAVSYT